MSILRETAFVTASRHVRRVLHVLVFAVPVLLLEVATVHVVLIRLDGAQHPSIWQWATMSPSWILLAYYIVLAVTDVPVHIANGGTRRSYALGVALGVPSIALVLAALVTAILPLERALLDLVAAAEPVTYFVDGTSLQGLVNLFLDSFVTSVVWGVSGLLLGIGYYRFGGVLGTLFLPVALLPMVAFEAYRDGGIANLAGHVPAITVPGTVFVALVAVLVAAGLAWSILRDVPVRSKVS